MLLLDPIEEINALMMGEPPLRLHNDEKAVAANRGDAHIRRMESLMSMIASRFVRNNRQQASQRCDLLLR